MQKPSDSFLMISLLCAVVALCILGFTIYVSSVPNNIQANGEDNVKNVREKLILINEKGFNPRSIEISAGDQLTWKNLDVEVHQIVFSLGFAYENLTNLNEKLEKGESVSYVFGKVGVFHYFDKLHPQFTGEVTVK